MSDVLQDKIAKTLQKMGFSTMAKTDNEKQFDRKFDIVQSFSLLAAKEQKTFLAEMQSTDWGFIIRVSRVGDTPLQAFDCDIVFDSSNEDIAQAYIVIAKFLYKKTKK